MQGDLLRPPFRTAADGGGFDLIYSIGVLHHLPDPQAGFREPLRYLRPGGTIAVWLYGYENNGFVRHVVEPLRRVSTTDSAARSCAPLAWPLALGFHGVAKGIYRPLDGTRVGRSLPLDEYMSSVADFSFRQNYGIVFDQLVAPTAAYIRGPELERLVRARAGSRTCASRTGTATRGADTAAHRIEMGVNSDLSGLLDLIVCPVCRGALSAGRRGRSVSVHGMVTASVCTETRPGLLAGSDDGHRPSALARVQYAILGNPRLYDFHQRYGGGGVIAAHVGAALGASREPRCSMSAPAQAWSPSSSVGKRVTSGATTTS